MAFFYDPFTQLGRHLLHITAIQRQFVGNLLIRHIESHKVEAQDPYLQGLMMSCENGVREIIKACVTVMTLIALTCRFRAIQAALDDVFGLTRGARDAVRPAQLAYRLITLTIISPFAIEKFPKLNFREIP